MSKPKRGTQSENGPERYGAVAIALHWLIAAMVVYMLWLGYSTAQAMDESDPRRFDLVQLHKSIGLTILILSIARLIWRIFHPPPTLPAHMPRWEKAATRASHTLFYVLILAVPLFGWATASASPLGLPIYLFGLLEWPHLPFLADLPRVEKAAVVVPIQTAHATLAYSLLALIALHVGAALKHHFWDRDTVLIRILPVRRKT